MGTNPRPSKICPCGCGRPCYLEIVCDDPTYVRLPDYINVTSYDDIARGVKAFMLGVHDDPN